MRANPQDQGVSIQRLELIELRAVHGAGDDLAHVIGGAHVVGDDAVQLLGVQRRGARLAHVQRHMLDRVQVGHDRANDLERMLIVLGHMVDHAGTTPVGVGAAQFLGADDLAGGGLHQRRSAQEDRALAAHDHRLVRHGGHVGAAGGARAHHAGDLGDALGAHPGLVVEDATEVLAVGEHLGLVRQVRAARVHQVDARQPVL